MSSVSYSRHPFLSPIIQHVAWLYLRFALSCREVEELLAERDMDLAYETVRRWVLEFGGTYAKQIRRARYKGLSPPMPPSTTTSVSSAI